MHSLGPKGFAHGRLPLRAIANSLTVGLHAACAAGNGGRKRNQDSSVCEPVKREPLEPELKLPYIAGVTRLKSLKVELEGQFKATLLAA